jgi:hypothetical protein
MTTVAIYSDSWSDPKVRYSNDPIDNIAWPDIISEHYNVTNYARAGTSIYYSYRKFLETHEDFNKIIFVVTDYYRWFHLIQTKSLKSPWGDYYHSFAGPGMIDYWKKDPLYKPHLAKDPKLRLTLDALSNYFGFLNDEEFDKTICKLMLDDIYRRRSDVIFIQGGIFPQFHPLVNPDTALAKFAMSWIKNWPEQAQQVNDGYGFFPWKELRTICHFSKEVNQAIAVSALEALQTGKWDPYIPSTIIAEHQDFNYYYDTSDKIW